MFQDNGSELAPTENEQTQNEDGPGKGRQRAGKRLEYPHKQQLMKKPDSYATPATHALQTCSTAVVLSPLRQGLTLTLLAVSQTNEANTSSTILLD